MKKRALSFAKTISCCFLLSMFMQVVGMAQVSWFYQINTFEGFKDDYAKLANELIDDAILGEFQPKFFGMRSTMTADKFAEQVPSYFKNLEPLGKDNPLVTRYSIPIPSDSKRRMFMRNILITSRWNKVENESQIVAVKIISNSGVFAERVIFLTEDSAEIKAIEEYYKCSIRYIILGKDYAEGCRFYGGQAQSLPPPPPPPPSYYTPDYIKEKETNRTSLIARSLSVLEKVYNYPNLEYLQVSCVTCLDFPGDINKLSKLKSLIISGSMYDVPLDYSGLDSLRELVLYTASPRLSEITGLDHLEYLLFGPLVWENGFPSFVEAIESLKVLELHYLYVMAFSDLEKMKIENLDKLILVSSHIPPLELFPGLKEIEMIHGGYWEDYEYNFDKVPLSIEKVYWETNLDSLATWLYHIPNLRSLSIKFNKKIPRGIEKLAIEELTLLGNLKEDGFPFFISDMPNLKTLDIGRLDSTLFEKMKEYSFANIEELTTTSGAIPPLQLFPNLKALTLKNWSWQKQKALDFTVIPNTLERITLETEIASLPAWMYDVSNLKELVVNCNNKFPSGIDELSISVLKIKRTLLDKIPPDVLARLRAMDHLDIRYFD